MSKKMIFSVLLFVAGNAVAADQVQTREQTQTRQTVGRQMMTDEEHAEQREKMRSAGSREEREKVRAEHHEKMKARAKEQGMSIPDNPPSRSQGEGMRGGMGGGQGGGMGGGRGGR